MKKLIILSILACILAGCSSKDEPNIIEETTEKTTEAATEISTEITSKQHTTEKTEPETIIVEVEKEVIVEVPVEVPVEKEVIKYQTIYSDSDTVIMPEKSQGSYLATVAGKYSQVAYLGRECKVETNYGSPVWSTSTPDICNVSSDGYIFAKKQGLAVVNDGQNNITIACTNSGDGKDPYSWQTNLYDNNYWDGGQYSYDLWQSKVNSVTDYLRFVWEQGFDYGDISYQCTNKWVGYGDPRTVLETRKGVCAEAAALVCGLLQYDYEDVGD